MTTISKNVQIEELPSLPKGIIDAYEEGNLAIFVGAGISRLMGCQGWDQMANDLIDGVCTPAMAEQIKAGCTNSKEKITIAKRLAFKDKEKEGKFWNIFEEAIKPKSNKKKIYDKISLLDTLFLTTNCDGLLVDKFPFSFSTICTIEEYLKHKDENYVFCLHGNWGKGTEADKNTLIFTADEYLEAYQPNKRLYSFLRAVMHDKTVLFIGYGLSEFEIISTTFEPADSNGNLKHYILEGFFRYQQELCNAKAEYYASINVNLVAFSRDACNYEQQEAIITNWIDELKNKTSYNSRRTRRFTDFLGDFSEENKRYVSQSLECSDSLRNTFWVAMLEELPQNDYCYNWISFLIDKEIIKSEQILGMDPAENVNKHIIWPFLQCLHICLKRKQPVDPERSTIVDFIRQSFQISKDEDSISVNELTLTNLWEVYLQLGELPNCAIEMSLWTYWASNTSTAIALIENEYVQLICDKLEQPADLLSVFYSNGDKANKEHRSYWFDKLASRIIDGCSLDTIFIITKNCINYLVNEEEYVDFYHSFDDRYHLNHYGYKMSLIKSIDSFMQKLNDEYQSKLVSELIRNAYTTFEYQVALHFATKLNKGRVRDFAANPLLKVNTYVDFYLWLNSLLSHYKYSVSDIDTIDSWISEASFGFDANDENDNEVGKAVSKRINTYKYQLYNLLSHANYSYFAKCNQIKAEDRFDCQTPLEDMEQYYTLRELPPDKYLCGVDLIGLSPEEIYSRIIAEKEKSHWSDDYYQLQEIIREAIGKISNDQLEEFLKLMLKKGGKELTAITVFLSDDAFLGRLDKSFLHNYLKNIYGVIVENDILLDESKQLISHLIYSLQHLDHADWTDEEIIKLVLSYEPTMLFANTEPYNEDMDVIMNVINAAEGQTYILLIDKIANCKQNESLVIAFKKRMESLIFRKSGIWLSLACAYRIQNLLYIDESWTRGNIIPCLEAADNPAQIGVCMCVGARIVLPLVVKYCATEERIEAIARLINKTEPDYRNADFYITYLAAAFHYKYLSYDNYDRFIHTLDEDAMNQLAWSYFFGISGIDREQRKELLYRTINLIDNDSVKSKFAKAILIYSSRCEKLDVDDWEIIHGVSKYIIVPFENEWMVFEDCLDKTKQYTEEISSVMEKLIELKDIPSEYTLDKILKSLSRLGSMNTIKRIASYAVGMGVSPNKYSKYGEKPELVSEDFDIAFD